MLSLEQTTAGGVFLLFGASVAWLVLTEFPRTELGKPTTSANPLIMLEAAVPSIGDFGDFNVNTENPFIPFILRKKEVSKIKENSGPRPAKKPPVAVVETPKPRELPRLPAPTTTGPRATGVLISKDGVQALLTFPGQTKAALMSPGDTTNGWTLVEVIDGNLVRMKEDATGTTHNLVIPESVAVHKSTAKPDEKNPDNKNGGGKGLKRNSPNGQQPGGPNPPQSPGQAEDRPIPQMAPPPLAPRPPEKLM